MTKIKTVGFLTASDPKDKKSWSGIHYRMWQALKDEFEDVYLIGPINKTTFINTSLLILTKLHQSLFSKIYNQTHNILLAKFYAHQIKSKLKGRHVDIIFAPAASTEISFLKTDIPICYLSDTSFGQISNYYDSFSNFSKWSLKESNLIEQRAINNSTTQVYSSQWAAQYVIDNYEACVDKVFTVKFGANIDFSPESKELDKKEFHGTINILFLGKFWKRKGGDIVLEAFDLLQGLGYDVTLTICGCSPSHTIDNPKIKIIPFLNKNISKDYNDFSNILKNSHLLFMPTRADCTPIVFCEANAYGIPVITSDTGGISSLIENQKNGLVLPYDSTSKDYAIQIQILLDNPSRLELMSLNSRRMFESELNWKAWAVKMKIIFIYTLNQRNHNLERPNP